MFTEILSRMVHDDLFVVVLLVLWSVIALAIICERLYALWGVHQRSEAFRDRVIAAVKRGELAAAHALCEASQSPLADVYEKALATYADAPETVADVVAIKRADVVATFKRNLWLLGTVGSSAPFVGLFGTVIGVVRSFHSMAQSGQGGFRVVSSGISEALGATALGLLVAIYAVVAYNYFVARVNRLAMSYKGMGEELVLALGRLRNGGDTALASPGRAPVTPPEASEARGRDGVGGGLEVRAAMAPAKEV
ncbi:MAG TPA: MotA/TolQ/ExbB proton channel family protein [Polyangia bacterium]|jgi:biopolymer transport protein ExbB